MSKYQTLIMNYPCSLLPIMHDILLPAHKRKRKDLKAQRKQTVSSFMNLLGSRDVRASDGVPLRHIENVLSVQQK